MQTTVPNPPDHIVMYATPYCGDTQRARRVLDELSIPYEFIDMRQDPAAGRIVEGITGGFRSSPTILFPDGNVLVEPSERELRAEVDVLAAAGYRL
ncbi:MAG TPA: glutaredoxin domain-containing protein [Anaerolineae bacterium]|nr:glutaredoxin domain-containing protein [Anaerolineae bacterium]